MGLPYGSFFLEIGPKNEEIVRKEFDLDRTERMEEAVNILRDWIQKQAHFKKKDFSTEYLEKRIILSKGLLERAKKQLDQIFTIRTLVPQYFAVSNMKDIEDVCSLMSIVIMPKTTEDLNRVIIVKFLKSECNSEDILNCFRYAMIVSEYLTAHDRVRGYIGVFDVRGLNIIDLIRKSNPLDMKHLASLLVGGYGIRVKTLHLLTDSKIIDVLVTFFKSLLSKKISDRVQVNNTVEELQETIPRKLLPKEYGGEDKSLYKITKEWVTVLSSKEHVAYFEELSRAGTDESLRKDKTQFNDEYAGMPGTFRTLIVD